nr:hypothetical protein [Tanacetum cinerariifolium]
MEKPDHRDPNAQDNTKQWKRCCFHNFTTSSYYGKDVAEMLSLGCDGEIDDMLKIRLHEARSNEEILTFVAWIRAFNINEPIYAKLCHEFYSTYEFDERTTGYDKIQKNDLWLLSMFDAKHQNGYANVAWEVSVLTEDVVRSLSALIYCRYLDTTTLKDLIDSDGKLIPEDPQLSVPRLGIPRPPRASMQDLYDRMGRMEIRQEGAYKPPGYAQPQYDQYYQQYQPHPPQYQQQQNDDE